MMRTGYAIEYDMVLRRGARNFGNQEEFQVSLQLAKPMERLTMRLLVKELCRINAALKIQGKPDSFWAE